MRVENDSVNSGQFPQRLFDGSLTEIQRLRQVRVGRTSVPVNQTSDQLVVQPGEHIYWTCSKIAKSPGFQACAMT